MEYLVLYIALSCFFVSAVLRWRDYNRKIQKQNYQWDQWIEYLGSLSANKPDQQEPDDFLFENFFYYYIKKVKSNTIYPELYSRWIELEKAIGRIDEFCSRFALMPEDQQHRIVMAFKIFPLPALQHGCLESILHHNQQTLLKEAVCIWARLPFDFAWNLLWSGIIFLQSPPIQFLVEHMSPRLEDFFDAKYTHSLPIKENEIQSGKIKKTLMEFLNHHEIDVQDLGIYGLGYFKQFQAADLLLDKLKCSGKNRQKNILQSLSKMEDKTLPEKIYAWIITVTYPEWETMEVVVKFFQSYGNDGKHWINQLRRFDHSFWQNYFKNEQAES